MCGNIHDNEAFSDTPVSLIVERGNNHYTLSQYYSRFGNASWLGYVPISTEFLRSMHCGKPLKTDFRGHSYCVECGKIFKGGKTQDDDHSDVKSFEKNLGPPPKRLLPKRWANVGRVTNAAP